MVYCVDYENGGESYVYMEDLDYNVQSILNNTNSLGVRVYTDGTIIDNIDACANNTMILDGGELEYTVLYVGEEYEQYVR